MLIDHSKLPVDVNGCSSLYVSDELCEWCGVHETKKCMRSQAITYTEQHIRMCICTSNCMCSMLSSTCITFTATVYEFTPWYFIAWALIISDFDYRNQDIGKINYHIQYLIQSFHN